MRRADFLFRGAFLQAENLQRLLSSHSSCGAWRRLFLLFFLRTPVGTEPTLKIGFEQPARLRIVRLIVDRDERVAIEISESAAAARPLQDGAIHLAALVIELHLQPGGANGRRLAR